ncbi:hydrogenase maturation protein HypF [Caloramator fervidus]|uniref:Carbamoyltransferase n=1 Tax=Caloramator fervidus TaxID=29344 RepID=A0A1H5UPA5_9CLOT|nr:carbamoyltransferase HypF [Caloramator fervidus]SEF76856.1 hydrogenase maturation protein HypF [Caloramator fervidus]
MQRAFIKVNGIVQGVGFRPFVNKLVEKYCLNGWIKNTSFGVEMEVEGDEENLKAFVHDIKNNPPKLAYIENLETEFFQDLKYYKEFNIIKSEEYNNKFTFISPDVGICEDCLRELFDENDKRYQYPFINCTNCGPRFTIIKDVPYDREKTTMNQFKMCEDCLREYRDIKDRRYHAQPNCCPECGPHLWFIDEKGNIFKNAIDKAIEYIKDGKIVAIKGIGGFHIACDAKNRNAVEKLRKRKGRDEKPFALMMKDVDVVKYYCYADEDEIEILNSYKRPIVLLRKKNNLFDHISENDSLGVMLPYTPLHYIIMQYFDVLVMTSGNPHDVPISYVNDEALIFLKDIVDGFLMHDRDIYVRCDDSIVKVFEGREYFIRRSRGYVPFPLKVNIESNILACGAEQKGSFALSKNGFVFLSQHIGELRNIETYKHFEEQIEHFKKLFDIKPEKIVCDMHPDYMSTHYASKVSKGLDIPLYKVQHHHAHMASCMVDNNIEGPVIGVVWDGTGFGLDGNIWGGEFLVGDYKEFKRVATIRSIKLPGMDKAVKEVYRIKYSILKDIFGGIPEKFIKTDDANIINLMLDKNINVATSTSIGRLFDGVASILGIKDRVTYEGQAAVLLESIAKESDLVYKYDIINGDIMILDWKPMIENIVEDLSFRDVSFIAAGFMNTLVKASLDIIDNLRRIYGINCVVVSGGVFQNIYLLKRMVAGLRNKGFDVYTHKRVSTNDEGIALGQLAVVANGGGFLCV